MILVTTLKRYFSQISKGKVVTQVLVSETQAPLLKEVLSILHLEFERYYHDLAHTTAHMYYAYHDSQRLTYMII